jgi:hypothetical protein
MSIRRVAVLADDLIWATRLADLVRVAGARVVACRSLADLDAALPGLDGAVVDLSARSFDPLAGIVMAADRVRVLAVGPHDDAEARRAARDAGADRVLAYRSLADAGAAAVELWLAADPRDGVARPADAVAGLDP